MSVTIPEFWSLAEKSRLFSPRVCAEVRDRWHALKGAERAGSARTLAEWLVAEGELTRYQAKLLLAGQPGPFLYGEYLVTKRLHRGRLEDCFQAVHAPTEFPVTLRFVRGTAFEPTTDVQDVKRLFERALNIERPLVPFYEWVDCGAYQFGVFGQIDGRPVSEVTAERGKLDFATACHVVREAARGIAAIHGHAAAHGAVRPESIWLAEDYRVAVLPPQLCEPWDRLRGRKLWLNSGADPAAIAVAEYTAPEAAGHPTVPTPAADVYALGCVLYMLLASRPPFTGANVADVLQQHASEPLSPVSRRSVPRSLDQVLDRSLAKAPGSRFADARQFADAVARVAGSTPPPMARAAGSAAEDAARTEAYLQAIVRRANGTTRNVRRSSVSAVEPPPAESPIAGTAEALPVAVPLSAGDRVSTAVAVPQAQAIPLSAGVSTRVARKRKVDWTAIGISTLVAFVAAAGVAVWHVTNRGGTPVAENNVQSAQDGGSSPDVDGETWDAAATRSVRTGRAAGGEQLIPDDGRALWASPTSGATVSAAFLPAGTQGILSVRLAELLAHPQGEPILAAAGPHLSGLLEQLRPLTGFEPHEIAHLTLALRAGEPVDATNLGLAIRPTPEKGLTYADLRNRLEGAEEVQVEGQAALLRSETAFYLATEEGSPVLVICAADELPEVLQRSGGPPPLAREVEQLLAASDVERHVTLVFPPRLVVGDGREFLSQHAALLRDPLQWFVGERTQAVLLSAHWGENFFLEMQAIAAVDLPPLQLRSNLDERLAELPVRIGDQVLLADLRAYGMRVVGRLPEMVRRMVSYTRSAVEGDRVVLRCYLPAPAGHNLLMASEIMLAEMDSGSGTGKRLPAEKTPKSVAERLDQVTSLSFTRDTLEAALEILAEDIGVPIEIRGNDLQLEGITKNQSFAIDIANRKAREILVEILRLANPDKAATSADDPRQKLIFTIEPDEAGQETVYVTTRKAAEQRSAAVPPEFKSP